MITAAQCGSARILLSWSLGKLASAASVPANVIDSFELERQRPDAATLGAIQRAFEDVGLVFLPDDDVRVRAATSTRQVIVGGRSGHCPRSRFPDKPKNWLVPWQNQPATLLSDPRQ